jgi:hypothetical protein
MMVGELPFGAMDGARVVRAIGAAVIGGAVIGESLLGVETGVRVGFTVTTC